MKGVVAIAIAIRRITHRNRDTPSVGLVRSELCYVHGWSMWKVDHEHIWSNSEHVSEGKTP